MTRISITLPSNLNQMIQYEAEKQATSVSDVIRTIMAKHFVKSQDKRNEKSLAALEKMAAHAQPGGERLSESIDEILYGEHGAWRGQSNDE